MLSLYHLRRELGKRWRSAAKECQRRLTEQPEVDPGASRVVQPELIESAREPLRIIHLPSRLPEGIQEADLRPVGKLRVETA